MRSFRRPYCNSKARAARSLRVSENNLGTPARLKFSMANNSVGTRAVGNGGMNMIPKKRSHSGGQLGGSGGSGGGGGGIHTTNASMHNDKRRRREGEDMNERGRREEKVERNENERGNEKARRPKRKGIDEHEEDSETVATVHETSDAFPPVKDGPSKTNILSTLTSTQIQTFQIPETFSAKVAARDWDLLCMKIRQSSRIRCKTRAAIAHLLHTDEHKKGETRAAEQQEGLDISAPCKTTTKDHGKGKNVNKDKGFKGKASKDPTPVVLLQASADAASKLISIVEIVKREPASDGQRWSCFQYSSVDGRVEELRPRKKHKRKDRSKSKASANILAGNRIKPNGNTGQQQRADDNVDDYEYADTADESLKPTSISSMGEVDNVHMKSANAQHSSSESASELDTFQTLSESRKKLRNMPYLTIYLACTRIPLLKSTYG